MVEYRVVQGRYELVMDQLLGMSAVMAAERREQPFVFVQILHRTSEGLRLGVRHPEATDLLVGFGECTGFLGEFADPLALQGPFGETIDP